MTMPASGTLNMGGTSTPVSVAQELGLSLTATITMNQSDVRSLAGVGGSGTTWSMSSLYGRSNRRPGITYAYRDGLSRAVANPSGQGLCITSNGTSMVLGGYNTGPVYSLIGSTTNGTSWTRRTDPRDSALGGSSGGFYQAAANNGSTRFIVGGYSGLINLSDDSGVTWSIQNGLLSTTFSSNTVVAAAYGAGIFVVCGTNRAVATSTDCVTWTYRAMPTITATNVLYAALYAFSLYWVAGQQGRVLVSSDAITWTYSTVFTTALGGTSSRVNAMAANGTRVIAAGYNQSFRAALIYGGTALAGPWTAVDFVTLFAWPTSNFIYAATWNGSVFCIGTSKGYVATSPDGITWTDRSTNFLAATAATLVTGMPINGLASRGTLIVATGGDTTGLVTTMAYSSDNGATWTSNTSIANNYPTYWTLIDTVRCADASSSKWICAGTQALVSYSTDFGVTWTTSRSIQNNLGAVWTNNDTITGISWHTTSSKFFAFGPSSHAASSPDGATWTNITSSLTALAAAQQLYNSLGANGYVAVVGSNVVFYTSDGTTWATTSTGATGTTYMSVCFTGTRWVVGGNNGTISYSSSAAPTSFTTPGTLSSTTFGLQIVRGLASNGTVTVAVGGTNAAVGTSTDNGATWTYRSGLNTLWGAVAATGVTYSAAAALFAAVGAAGRLATSTDGITWTNVTNMSSSSWGSSTTPSGNSLVPNSEAQVIVSSSGGSDWLVLGANGRCFTSPA